jgi:elongation factor 1 alpha-like protein
MADKSALAYVPSVGNLLCNAHNPVNPVTKFTAKIIVFDITIPILPGAMVLFHVGAVSQPAVVTKLLSLVNKSSGEVEKKNPR